MIFVTSAHARPDVRNCLTSGNGCFQSPSFPYHVTKKRRTLGTRTFLLKTVDLWFLTYLLQCEASQLEAEMSDEENGNNTDIDPIEATIAAGATLSSPVTASISSSLTINKTMP